MDAPLSKPRLGPIGVASVITIYVLASVAGAVPARTHAQGEGQEEQFNRQAAKKALAWLKTQQQPDGSFGIFHLKVDDPASKVDDPARAEYTIYTLLAILSAGQDPAAYSMGGNTPVTYLESHRSIVGALSYPLSPGLMLLAASMLKKQGRAPFRAEAAMLDAINSEYDPQTGFYGVEHLIYGRNIARHVSSMLGIASLEGAGSVPRQAVAALESIQMSDGGWPDSAVGTGQGSRLQVTTLAVQTLVAVGGASPDVLAKAHNYIARQQNPDGGYARAKERACCGGSESAVESTAFAVQALIALGAESSELRAPLAFLASTQKANGAFMSKLTRPETEGSLAATYYAIPAILGVSFANPSPNVIGDLEVAVLGMPIVGVGDKSLVTWIALAGLLLFVLGTTVKIRATSSKS